jgi:hypothetical protein
MVRRITDGTEALSAEHLTDEQLVELPGVLPADDREPVKAAR